MILQIVPLYQTMVICLRSLLASTDSLVALSPLLASGFRRSSDTPPAILQTFTEFWGSCSKHLSQTSIFSIPKKMAMKNLRGTMEMLLPLTR